jgi:plastocyanin
MDRNALIALIVIVLLAIGAYFVFAKPVAAPTMAPGTATAGMTGAVMTATTTITSTTTVQNVAAKTLTVTYTNSGFSPNTVNAKVGDTVHFINSSSHGMWVASNEHPTHTDYDGTSLAQHCTGNTNNNGSFDECAAVPPGTSYSFTFPKTGAFHYHNHVSTSDTGTVLVQ